MPSRRSVPPAVEKFLFSLRALYLFAVVEIALRTTTLPAVATRLGIRLASGSTSESCPHASERAREAARVVRRVNLISRRWPLGDTCLRRSLVAGSMLRTCDPLLWIGIDPRRGVASLDAHAWLEIDGFALDPTSRRFQTFSFD